MSTFIRINDKQIYQRTVEDGFAGLPSPCKTLLSWAAKSSVTGFGNPFQHSFPPDLAVRRLGKMYSHIIDRYDAWLFCKIEPRA